MNPQLATMLKRLSSPPRPDRPPYVSEYVSDELYKEMPDDEIVRRVLAGSTPLFEVLMRRYNQRLYRIQRSYISDDVSVQDTLQITWIRIFENLSGFRHEALFSTWITRIAINEALKQLRKRKRFMEIHVMQSDGTEGSSRRAQVQEEAHQETQQESPESRLIRKETKALLEETIERLPQIYRSVYVMREVEQMSTQETALCLSITESNVKARLHRARRMIREDLERRVSGADLFPFLGSACDTMVCRVMWKLSGR